eukprot:m.106058 g.106058  ORF g.106058 m.106058 type:complete len:79 (+) comp27696_c0_seq3:448-684(+)
MATKRTTNANANAKLGVAKARILCLHGFGTNSKIMEFQLMQLKRWCTGLELVFINGPSQSAAAEGYVAESLLACLYST